MTPEQFEALLTVARRHGVSAFKLGDLAVQFEAKAPIPFDEPEISTQDAGQWKRPANLEEDEE